MLGGTGTVLFTGQYQYLNAHGGNTAATGATLTIGPGITIHGGGAGAATALQGTDRKGGGGGKRGDLGGRRSIKKKKKKTKGFRKHRKKSTTAGGPTEHKWTRARHT